ncbi:DUF2169 domain-containing protein [Bordetella sp. N]|uniref:DUF2169 family type VI secretion system accessory protein n=1 Tax=Bordetella sp. N TaxID=1746199 RepID=UPI00070AA2E9|nr:DUF2169 domain-containing protein [Bordetella sp. N]ALM85920.1 hypothetical protein ASB57_25890 [Bordetella sp. N]
MKTIKPFRLSLLTRPYRWQRADTLGVAVMALATLDDAPRLMPEQELWKLAAEETGGILDLGVPKACAEFLVSGNAYTRHQADKTACGVRIRVGELDKSLLVFGDRYWMDGRASKPAPFEQMRVDWTRAYGGAGHAVNPQGMGMATVDINGVHMLPLPNVEASHSRIGAPRQNVEPGGLTAYPPDAPQRFALIGSKYGQDWLEQDYPGFAQDMDWRFFNAAPADQRRANKRSLDAGSDYEIWNMHPDRQVLRGRLPDWKARCFASRRSDGTELEDIDLKLSTAWFFPHRERVLLIWHGALPIREDDAADVKLIMPALELADQPRPLDHYLKVAQQRLDKDYGAVHALCDDELVPESIQGEWLDGGLPDTAERPMVRNILQGTARKREAWRQELVAAGMDPDLVLAAVPETSKPPAVAELPEMLRGMEAQIREQRASLDKARADALADPDLQAFARKTDIDVAGIADHGRAGDRGRLDPEEVHAQLADFDANPVTAAEPSKGQAGIAQRLGPQVDRLYLNGAHMFDAPPGMSPHRAQRTRRRVTEIYAGNRDFTGMNLIGADLSDMDLRGACFRQAALEGANLTGARLDHCDFTGAVLARAAAVNTSFAAAIFTQANLSLMRGQHARFDQAVFADSVCVESVFEDCVFADAEFLRTQWREATCTACDFTGARFAEMAPMTWRLTRGNFARASFRQCAFMACELEQCSFVEATLMRCSFVNTVFSGATDFTRAAMTAASFCGTTALDGACFREASLAQCGMRGTSLARTDFSKAMLAGSDFSECCFHDATLDGLSGGESLFVRADFSGASLRDGNLIQSILSKAIFLRADLSGANLFRADVSQAAVDGSTLMDGAYTRSAKVWPRRREAAA